MRTLAVLVLALLVTISLSGARGAIPDDKPGVLVSRQLMEARGLHEGDVVRFATDANGAHAREFRIAGTYEPDADPLRFAQARHEVRLHLPDLIDLTKTGDDPSAADAVSAINVKLKEPADATRFAKSVTTRVPGAIARPTSAPDERTTTFVVLERFHLAIAIVTVVGSAVFLLALMVMLVDERRATVGILRLLGFTRQRILAQVFTEGALIALAGALFGILFALASQGVFNRFFQWRYDTSLVFLRITPGVVLQSVLMAVPLGAAASIVASWTLLRRELLTLIRR